MYRINNSMVQSDKQIFVYALGQFNVKDANGQSINIGGRSKKTWDLLKYIITFKEKNISINSILENVYPEEYYYDPSNTIKNSIYRLRKRLQKNSSDKVNSIIYQNGGYSLNRTDCVYLDTDDFENISHKALMHSNTEPLLSIALYRQCLEMYKGDYLYEDYNNDWILPLRLYYRRMYLNDSIKLLSLLNSLGKFKEIVDIVSEILIREGYEEDIQYFYMDALLNMGDKYRMIQHYEYITDLYKKTYDIEPSKKIEDIYKSVFV